RELEEAETKKSLFAAEIHRLEVERVGLEHAKLSADQELARLTQTVQALVQEQSDLTTALHLLNEEIRQCHDNVEARTHEQQQRERFLTEKQTALNERR